MKNLIRQKSLKTKLPPQQLYGLYAMDQLVAQLSKTKYSKFLIVKGGFLLTTVHGLENRATGDLDFTIKNLALTEENIISLFESLPDSNKKQFFEVISIKKIREHFEYDGYEAKLIFHNDGMRIPINVDLTTGEALIPTNEFEKITSVFTNEIYSIVGYPIEQVLTDKFYTLIAYGSIDDTNSRMKDYYDLYLLTQTKLTYDIEKIRVGLQNIMKQRDNYIAPEAYGQIIKYLQQSELQIELWSNFENNMPYAKGISFEMVMNQVKDFSERITDNI